MNQSKKVTEGALLTAIFIVLLVITVFVPGISLITTFMLPVPFIYYTYKYDWQPSLIMLSVAIILSLLIATVISLPLTILVSCGGIMIGMSMHRRLTAYETWARGTAGFVVGLLLVFIFIQSVLQINLVSEMNGLLNESFEMSKSMMQEIGFLNVAEEDWQLVEKQLSMMKNLIPVGITIFSVIFAFISQWLSYKLLNRLENQSFFFPPFRELRLPITVVWIYFFAMIFMFMELNPDGMVYLVAYNVFSLVGMFLVLQGFSFLFYMTHKKKLPKFLPIIGVIFTLILPFILLYFVRVIGIIDIGFGLRDRKLTKKK